tara:strand:- start:2359 stop:3633 length:1275 start_codon:yes stop_codon:yes gene_type:complete
MNSENFLTEESKSRIYFKRDRCRLCNSLSVELVMPFVATPVGDHYVAAGQLDISQEAYSLDLYFCNSCGQLQLLDVVDPAFIYGEYLYETSTSMGLVEHFQRYADDLIETIHPHQGSFAVDIGCNDGSFLKYLRQKNLSVLGIEPAKEIAKKVESAGIDVLNTFFSHELACKIKEERGAATVISANNVMANVEDLGDFAKGIRELLSPDGIFTFESGSLVDLIRNCVIDNIYHEHLCYFRLNPLVKYFQNHGLEVVDIQHSPTKGGSLRGTIQHKGTSRNISPAVLDRMSWETSLGFDQAETYKEFASRMEGIRKQLLSLLNDLKKNGKTISGYGASVGVTTLLYYYGAGQMLDVLYDDNPIKQGLYSPGYHIPVNPSPDIYKNKPDYILIFAWRYAVPIMKKHAQYLANGGHFIVPLPGIEVI